MKNKFIAGILGPGESSTPEENEWAFELGRAVAQCGWILLTGGRSFDVMDSAMKGAVEEGGLTLGILPADSEEGSSENARIKIITGMGSARNQINILSSDLVVVVGMAPGTASAVALAIKAGKKVILYRQEMETIGFFKKLGGHLVIEAHAVEEIITLLDQYQGMHKNLGWEGEV